MYYNKKYQDFIDDNFFVIDSNNCKNIKGKLYGFVLSDNKLTAFKDNYNKHIEKKEYGTYINIIKEDEKLIIEQDAIGSYGLFIYQKDNYFAISNSFYYLVLYLQKNKKLTIDIDCYHYFMLEIMSSRSITKTLIEEISQIDKDIKITIDINTLTINLERDKHQSHIYDIDSKECFEILDKWFSKYCSLILFLNKTKNFIEMTLSGGKDSRLILTMFNYLNLLSKINFRSLPPQSDRAKVDFVIASHIGQRYNFQLNKNNTTPTNKISPNEDILLTFLSELGTQKEFYFLNEFYLQPVFSFGGLGGEFIQNTWKGSQEDFLKNNVFNLESVNGISSRYLIKTLNESFNYLRKITHENIGAELHNYTWIKTHYGKSCAHFLLKNDFHISPLLDPILQLIQTDNHNYDDLLLHTIIYQRYMPDALDIPFDSNWTKEFVKKQAEEIQKKYPKHVKITDNFILDFGKRIIPDHDESHETAQNILSNFFDTQEVFNFSNYFFNEKLYPFCIMQKQRTRMHMNLSDPNTLAALCIFTKTILTNNFSFEDYLHPITTIPINKE